MGEFICSARTTTNDERRRSSRSSRSSGATDRLVSFGVFFLCFLCSEDNKRERVVVVVVAVDDRDLQHESRVRLFVQAFAYWRQWRRKVLFASPLRRRDLPGELH